MSSQENVEIVRSIYAGWAQGDMGAGAELFDPEVVFESFMPDAEERVVAHGPDGIVAFMREFLKQFSDYRLFGDEFRVAAEDMVFVAGRQAGTGRQSGVPVEGPTCSVWKFRDGKVVGLLFDTDRQAALEVAGLSE
ncbi:MAG: nuclear transport factor 2 family protein [Solirubrobacterales bacterium]